MTTQICRKCKIEKPAGGFCQNKNTRSGLQLWCRECTAKSQADHYAKNREKVLAKNKEWQDKNPERVKANNRDWVSANKERVLDNKLKWAYGVGLDWFNEQIALQGGRCPICLGLLTEGKKRACVDHSHEDDEVRGVLCGKCNLALGLLDDNPDALERAADYLRNARPKLRLVKEIQDGD